MKINIHIVIAAVIYNLINLAFWEDIKTMPNATSMVYLIIYPSFGILTLVVVIYLSFRNKRKWFSRQYLLSTIIGLIFCTPIAFGALLLLSFPIDRIDSSGGNYENGHATKFEEWDYQSGEREVTKYWKDDKKDSVWIYFSKKGDTIKTETYRNDKLISLKKYK